MSEIDMVIDLTPGSTNPHLLVFKYIKNVLNPPTPTGVIAVGGIYLSL